MSTIKMPKETSKIQLNTIEEAINDIRNGKVIIVVDDEDRENEGDFLAAAEMVTPQMINFMATHGRGLICTPLTEKRCKELELNPMVHNNTDPLETAFTISVDLRGNGVTTGISAGDRAKTVKALVDDNTKPFELARPGHIFPLVAREGGVLRRTGHTEAAIDFARLAGLKPAGVIVEIMNEDGTMARLPQLMKVAEKFDLKIVSIEDLVAYRMQHDSLIEKKEDFEMVTRFGKFRLRAYQQTTNNQVHIAITKGAWNTNEHVLTRVNSTLVNNDILGTLTNNADKKLDDMFKLINDEGKGAIIFINQQNQSTNLLHRLSILKQEQNHKDLIKAPSIQMDHKDFGIGAQILHDLNIHKLRLMSNSEQTKRVGMIGYGLEIIDYVTY
ncbi:3,4-dihydroxy-2-butanone-4-phosphate synthase [Xanthomarina sp.]|uniref:3,4-dihydroxy-2-butanone-4-phosphate synthase n=1 Tax=Xanthomarina sp. TaxID=1931211 RepID=UPI002CC52EBB|nr:3,4-dihydroxy-2-butanone-4-phosphate synthase [Xanthomarina sp.]HLV37915.1 3,4-dihydroxy-2-butanone-4-phosphate synthase [Xanthomarina sp.]